MANLIAVFVYGTLKAGERNHYLLQGATRLEERCWTYGKLYDTGNGYPCVCEDFTTKVFGELYNVSEEQLKKLDLLEGYLGEGLNNHYERIEQDVFTDKNIYSALIYVYPAISTNSLIEIPSGEW